DAAIARSTRLPALPQALPAIPREDLEHIDFTRPIPADLDLLAEVLLAAPQPGVRVDRSPGFGEKVKPYFQTLVDQRVSYVTEALKGNYDGDWPRDDRSLRDKLAESGIDVDTMRDPWGNPYRARFGIDGRF